MNAPAENSEIVYKNHIIRPIDENTVHILNHIKEHVYKTKSLHIAKMAIDGILGGSR